MNISLVWIRNDLRFEDNTALVEAVNNAEDDERILLVFHIDQKQLKPGAYSHNYFFSALKTFYQECLEKKLNLYFLYDEPEVCFSKLIKDFPDINKIYYNIDETGYGKARDRKAERIFEEHEIEMIKYYDHHLHFANEILKEDGSHYKMFTPYYNKWKERFVRPFQKVDYDKLRKIVLNDFFGKDIEGKNTFTDIVENIADDFSQPTGEKSAETALESFVRHKLADYGKRRDYPYMNGTSRISHFLSTGQLSIRQVYERLLEAQNSDGKEMFLKELAWRDFYNMIYAFYPNQKDEEIITKYQNIIWQYDEFNFQRWKEGRTGFPIVDAAMRQLSQEGWMHNRLRMIVASFFTKDLLMDWRIGEAYFSEMLIDYDSASNIGGWQWAASVGTDAVPYFRVFNPSVQSERFDPEGKFIKKYVQELKDVPIKYIHNPYKYSAKIRKECGIEIENIYTEPIVNHQVQRRKAIEMFGV